MTAVVVMVAATLTVVGVVHAGWLVDGPWVPDATVMWTHRDVPTITPRWNFVCNLFEILCILRAVLSTHPFDVHDACTSTRNVCAHTVI